MRMQGMSYKDFSRLLMEHGWYRDRQSGSHVHYRKDGEDKIVTLVDGHKELSRPVTKRLLKELNLLDVVYGK